MPVPVLLFPWGWKGMANLEYLAAAYLFGIGSMAAYAVRLVRMANWLRSNVQRCEEVKRP